MGLFLKLKLKVGASDGATCVDGKFDRVRGWGDNPINYGGRRLSKLTLSCEGGCGFGIFISY